MNGPKMQTTYLLVVFAIVVQQTFAKEFPEFLKKCKVNDPKFDDCVLNSANTLMSVVIKGDPKYGKAPMELSNQGSNFNFTEKFTLKLRNQSGHLQDGLVVTQIHFGIPEKLFTFVAKCPQMRYTGNYEAIGEILGKPVHETGKVNMTFDDVQYNVSMPLQFVTRKDIKFLDAISCNLTLTGKNFQFKPFDQVTVGEPMTAEQKLEYESYIAKIPAKIKNENELSASKDILRLMNIFFEIPYEHLFLQ